MAIEIHDDFDFNENCLKTNFFTSSIEFSMFNFIVVYFTWNKREDIYV